LLELGNNFAFYMVTKTNSV